MRQAKRHPARHGLAIAGLLTVILAAGCQPRDPIVPAGFMPSPVDAPGPVPTYAELVDRYNAQVRNLDRLWSSTDVEMRWRDDNGKTHLEKGDGKFLFVRPGRVALTIEKLGKTYLWAGTDRERYWLFDNQEDVAYVGHHRHIGKPCAQPLPLPIHPAAVPYLLGLMPLPQEQPGSGPGLVMQVRGHYLVEPPGGELALWLHPQTLLPVRVDLTDTSGRSVVRAMLSEHRPVELDAVPRDQWPMMASRAELFIDGEEARMTLDLSRLSDGQRRNRIRDAAFDFDRLRQAHNPDEVVKLDADCEAAPDSSPSQSGDGDTASDESDPTG